MGLLSGISSILDPADFSGFRGGRDAEKTAEKAADVQAAAADRAAQLQREMFDQIRQDFAPARATGTNALFSLASALGQAPTLEQLGLQFGLNEEQMAQLLGSDDRASEPFVTKNFAGKDTFPGFLGGAANEILGQRRAPGGTDTGTGFDPDVELVRSIFNQQRPSSLADMVQADPGFQFRMDQGQKAIERSAAARGGLFSGKTGKSLLDFSQGLASQETGNAFNRLASLAGIGQTASGTTAPIGANLAGTQGDFFTQAANARASGFVGAANARADQTQNQQQLAATVASLFLSDRRVKENIRPIGKTDGGYPIYAYNYIGQTEPRIGVIAQDVEKIDPEAVVEINGIKHVDYSRIH